MNVRKDGPSGKGVCGDSTRGYSDKSHQQDWEDRVQYVDGGITVNDVTWGPNKRDIVKTEDFTRATT